MIKDQGLIRLADISTTDLQKNYATIQAGSKVKHTKVNSAIWFLPIVTHSLKGGVRTVFMFSEKMSIEWGTLNTFVLYSHNGKEIDTTEICRSLTEHFPKLRFIVKSFRHGKDDIEDLPFSDISFCTLWTTAYVLLKYNQTYKKYYFMQDYEPLFYEAGSVYAVIEQTYRFGFSCIANTPGVGKKYLQYSNDVTWFFPGVDNNVFNSTGRSPASKPFKVVFYGRPDNPRNCFTQGVLTLKALKRKMKHHVEIFSAGASWNPVEFGLDGVVENLGLLSSLKEVADLYRRCDLGLVYMVTPHPSYQPFEYMACGCLVATNINEANSWMLNSQNSIQLEPIPEIAAQKICEILSDTNRSEEIRSKAYETIKNLNWPEAFSVFKNRILK